MWQSKIYHYVKSVPVWSFSDPCFSAFGLNTENMGQKNFNTDTHYAMHFTVFYRENSFTTLWQTFSESAKLRAFRALAPYPSLIRAFTLTNKRLTRLFLSSVVVSIVKYGLRFRNPRKATGPYFIPLKVIKFASIVIDSHLYNIITEDLEENKYSEEPKTALAWPIFKKNKRNKQSINY